VLPLPTVTHHAPNSPYTRVPQGPNFPPKLKTLYSAWPQQMRAWASLPPPHIGYLYVAASAVLLVVGTYSILLGALFSGHAAGPNANITAINALERDGHYKYLALFSVPICAYFVIANWVGWQFFRNS